MGRVLNFLFGLAAAAALGLAAVVAAQSDRAAPPSGAADSYVTAPVEIGHVRRTVTALGTLQAVSTVLVSAQQAGQVTRLLADFNDEVRAGQPLALLDQRDHQARLDQTRAEAAVAEADLDVLAARVDEAGRSAEEAAARRGIVAVRADQARIRLDAAQSWLDRANALARRGAAAAAMVEEAESEHAIARAALAEAEAEIAAQEIAILTARAGLEVARAERARAEAALPRHAAAVRLAELELDRAIIRAPADGVVIGRAVEAGQTVAASLDAPPLFTLAGNLGRMEIHASIDESDISEIAVGQDAGFSVDALPGRAFAARVRQIRKAPRLAQGVVVYTVVLDAPNPDLLLLPGMTSVVRIVVEDTGPVATVPLAALSFTPEGRQATGAASAIWLLRPDGALDEVQVEVGTTDGARAAVSGPGLAAGARVVVARARPGPAS